MLQFKSMLQSYITVKYSSFVLFASFIKFSLLDCVDLLTRKSFARCSLPQSDRYFFAQIQNFDQREY